MSEHGRLGGGRVDDRGEGSGGPWGGHRCRGQGRYVRLVARQGRPEGFELAKRIGLDGVEVSIGDPKDGLHLRRPERQREYLAASRKYAVAIPSVAMGVLNWVPLMSEPLTALWVADTIEAAKNLGAKSILLAFFAKGELKEENKDDMRRVTEVLTELAPRAEKAGVILGIESYLRAEAVTRILDEVKSKYVQVYYDFYNLGVTKQLDVIREIQAARAGPHLPGAHQGRSGRPGPRRQARLAGHRRGTEGNWLQGLGGP